MLIRLLHLLCLFPLLSYAQAKNPNIIIIYVDDLGYGDLGLYQDSKINAPSVDEFVNAGQSWTNFYVSASVCSPSRGALLTGNLEASLPPSKNIKTSAL